MCGKAPGRPELPWLFPVSDAPARLAGVFHSAQPRSCQPSTAGWVRPRSALYGLAPGRLHTSEPALRASIAFDRGQSVGFFAVFFSCPSLGRIDAGVFIDRPIRGRVPAEFPQSSRRVPAEFPQSSRRVPADLPQSSRRSPAEFPQILCSGICRFAHNWIMSMARQFVSVARQLRANIVRRETQ